LVILNPFEVNELLPKFRTSKFIHLHVYTPRTLKVVLPCDDLLLYNIPAVRCNWTAPIPVVDQLYLRDYMTATSVYMPSISIVRITLRFEAMAS
ncbi:hypothetical protein V8B97DRAFT_1871654, partial [Scleroderma yunnanense]